jgi:hypothetical protein
MSPVIAPKGRRGPAWIRVARNAGWPATTGLVAFLIGLLMLAASLLLGSQVERTVPIPDAPRSSPRSASNGAIPTQVGDGPAIDAPRYETHLDDVAFIFALATEHGVAVGPVDYRTEARSSLPVLVRTLDLHLAEDYPRFKPFVADLLARLPHLYLQEIRIERGNAETPKAQITLKLALVYRIEGQKLPLSDPRAATSSAAGSAQP